jgi:predicted nucleic acid-binding protein
MILIDTTVLSKVYRRKKISLEDQHIVNAFYAITDINQELLIGPVRQEVLSGISDYNIFTSIKEKLDGSNNYVIQLDDHDLAAEYSNICQDNGIQGSPTDFLLCAIASRYDMEIFTEDRDFLNYKKHLPIKLFLAEN